MTAAELTARRAALGLSQSQFAAALGISVRTIQEWEQGRRTPRPSIASLIDRVIAELETEQSRQSSIQDDRKGVAQ